MNEFLSAAVVAALFLLSFIYATFVLSALMYGSRVVPIRLRGVVRESLEAQGRFRVVGMVFWSAVAILLQALLVGALFGRNGPLEVLTRILLLTELAAAAIWSYVWVRHCRRAQKTSP
jgi:hypothetical protein